MAEFQDERQLVLEVQSRMEEWTNTARTQAYADLFAGDDPILDEDDERVLDAIDSALERQGGDGVWGTDRYGVHTAGSAGGDADLRIVCVYHPQITADTVLRGAGGLDDETEERLNSALWTYSERVATLIERELEEYVQRKYS